MKIYIANQMIESTDSRLHWSLAEATANSARIVAHLVIDVGGTEIQVGDPHMEAIVNSASGRARLAEYPQQVQGWIIPGIWGQSPTIVEETV